MRKQLIVILFLGAYLSSSAQSSIFNASSNTYLSVSPYKFWFQGDTVIDTKPYKKVFQQTGDSIADFNHAVYYASVRVDTLSSQVYCIQKDDGTERLIADFSLSEGDTVSVYSYWPFGSPTKVNVTIKDVDSILISNKYHKRLNIDGTSGCLGEGEAWIEGIGSTHGLFFPYSVTPDLTCTELLCVVIDSVLYYKNPNCNECFKSFDLSAIVNKEKTFKISPSPAQNILNINTEEADEIGVRYCIYNTQGVLVDKNELRQNSVDISELPKGFYFITLLDTNGLILNTSKFLKI